MLFRSPIGRLMTRLSSRMDASPPCSRNYLHNTPDKCFLRLSLPAHRPSAACIQISVFHSTSFWKMLSGGYFALLSSLRISFSSYHPSFLLLRIWTNIPILRYWKFSQTFPAVSTCMFLYSMNRLIMLLTPYPAMTQDKGIFTVKHDPSPSTLVTLIEPLCISTALLVIASPSPVPPISLECDLSTR